jgi:hypothetical protein
MDAIQRKLTQLLDSKDLELRTAAVQVITEVGVSSKQVTQALARCLREPHENLRIAALRGLARLGAQDVSHVVVPLLLSSGPLREQAMAVIAAIGPSVIPQLTGLYTQADFHGKRAIITALARVGGKAALSFLLKILPGEPFEIQKHLTLSVCEALDRTAPASQAPIFSLVIRTLRGKVALKNPQILITGAILLGHFRGHALAARARRDLKLLAERKHPPEVRRHALVSFNRLIPEHKLMPQDEAFLYKMLCEEDWHNVAQHALTGFQRLDLPKQRLSKLVDLLNRSPHFSVHIHVFERLQTIDRTEVAEAILPFLSDPRFRVREAAEAALRKMPSAIESLFSVLMRADDLEVTQRINSILRDFPQETRKKYLDRACGRLLGLFDHNDPHYRSFLDFVRSVDPEPLRKRIYEKARSLKAGRSPEKWERIAQYLQLLWDNHLITAEGRYLLGVAHVRTSGKDLAPAARRANLGLQVLRSLIYDDYAGLAKKLAADRDLTPEDFYYLGFHFSESGDDMRPFATAMLEHVVKKYPKVKVAAAATQKLELAARLRRESEEAEAAALRKESSRSRSKAKLSAPPVPPAAAAPAAVPAGAPVKAAREPQAPGGAAPPRAQIPRAAKSGGEKTARSGAGGGRSVKAGAASGKHGKGASRPDRKRAGGSAKLIRNGRRVAAKKARKRPPKPARPRRKGR